ARERIKIAPSDIDLEELSQVWGTFSQPFRLSVSYEVSVAQVDQSTATGRALPTRVTTIGVPTIKAPYQPPVVEQINPASAIAGSVVTFSGEHLDGWTATVRVSDTIILNAAPVVGDSFTAILPNGLLPGFYDLQVDVAHLFRRSFTFEVTP